MAEENNDNSMDELEEHEERDNDSEQEFEFMGTQDGEQGRGTDSEQDEVDKPNVSELQQQKNDEKDDFCDLEYKLKRFKKDALDRISNLPDSILLCILSSLPMKEVIRTGILSKRWLRLWTSATTLDFNYQGRSSDYNISKFITFIDKTLVRCSVSHVHKIAIEFPYRPRHVYDVSGWMQFASTHSIHELELRLRPPNLNDQYYLPQSVYENSFLRKLSLSSCKFSRSYNIKWNHLSILNLEYVQLNEELLRKILSSCPELDSLELSICRGIEHFVIESTSLRKFVLKGYWDKFYEEDDSYLEISAPNIKSLEISGFMHRKMVRIVSAPSLVEAKLDFYRTIRDDEGLNFHRTNRYNLADLLESLQCVEKLTIGSWCIQVLSLMTHRVMTLPQLKCNFLTLNAQMKKWDIPGTDILLQISPKLETAVIKMNSPYKEFRFGSNFMNAYNFDANNYLVASGFRHVLSLKLIKICGFWEGNTENIIQFVQIILKNALMLQKLAIDALKDYPDLRGRNPREALQVAQKLLSFPRSSRDAIVVL